MTTPAQSAVQRTGPRPDPAGRTFIEVQFPVSKLSKECYNERTGAQGQTLTGLGKWWGRKPLVLVRSLILGLLLPATDDPEKDRDVFLTLMMMDEEGLWRRVANPIPARVVYEYALPRERAEYFDTTGETPRWKPGLSAEERRSLQRRAFFRMSYDEKLEFCVPSGEVDGPDEAAWAKINSHLGTSAGSIPELIRQLGERRFGHVPRVGDAFSGGGSIPFEAARIGCDAYGSDLNPVAGLLTWAALNIVGGGDEVVRRVSAAQRRVFEEVRQQVEEWGIERNEEGWVADAYLYCHEAVDPITGWTVPLAPSWVIAKRAKRVIARLIPDPARKRFDIEIVEGVSPAELKQAAAEGTWQNGLRCPVDANGRWLPVALRQSTSLDTLRGRQGFRLWENDDLVPRPDDVLQERLYCIRWVDPETGQRYYRAPTAEDLEREQRVLNLLRERFAEWQATGCIPNRRIEPGYNTDRPIRERGWTHWHHLFNPRQLLVAGLFMEKGLEIASDQVEKVTLLLAAGRLADWNSRLCRWDSSRDQGKQTFYNQALNTLLNYSCRATSLLEDVTSTPPNCVHLNGHYRVKLTDARAVDPSMDLWITDPGYADAINYDELSEYFLAWYDKRLPEILPGWYSDSRRALTVKGTGESFRVTLAECYKRLTERMSDKGFQVVMFTHQDPAVWADLALVLWSAGLQVTAAWTVQTETTATGVRRGNLVQSTVCLVLRKRQEERYADLADLYPDIQAEVERQLQSMLEIDDKDDPNFGDADYQLAAYAAALRVLTSYSQVGDIDVDRELRRSRGRNERSPLTQVIEQAVKIASDVLVPDGFDKATWRTLGPEERFYLKGIEVESSGESREGVYQELARGYGANDYRDLLASRAANATRLKTPSEFAGRDLRSRTGFGSTLLRQTLYAIYVTASNPERDPKPARDYLKRELPDYWSKRATIIEFLRYLSTTPHAIEHWTADRHAARLLLGSIESDSV